MSFADEVASVAAGGIWSKVKLLLRSRITAGLALVLPVWITVLVVSFVFRVMRNASFWLLEAIVLSPLGASLLQSWNVDHAQLQQGGLEVLPLHVQWGISIASVVLTVVLLYLLGGIATNVVGLRLVALGESVVNRVPLVKVIYQASKKVVETFSDSTRPFQRVVLVLFPTRDTRSVGFVTRRMQDAQTGEDLYGVFLPTTPNPTGGFVLLCRRCDVIEVDWSVEDAFKVIMSGGMLIPDAIALGLPPQGSQPAP